MRSNLTKTRRFTLWLGTAVLLCGWGMQTAAEQAPLPESEEQSAKAYRLTQLIDNLVSDHQSVRAAAIEELNTFDETAYKKLIEASKDTTRPERAAQASKVVQAMNSTDLRISDTFGRAITGATVTLIPGDGSKRITTRTNPLGGIHYEPVDRKKNRYPSIRLRVEHPAYGIVEQSVSNQQWRLRRLQTALIHKDHELVDEAIRGVVVDDQGRPVPNTQITCSGVSHAGGRHVSCKADVMTDAQGAFRFRPTLPFNTGWNMRAPHEFNNEDFLLGPEPRPEIPAKYNTTVTVTPPEGSGLWPQTRLVNNEKPTRITLLRPTLQRSFAVESPDGGLIKTPAENDKITLGFLYPNASHTIKIEHDRLIGRSKLVAGQYHLTYNNIVYPPISVDADSADTIVFKLPPVITYAGQVLDGKTGKPIEGVLVFGWSGSRDRDTLALMTPKQWDALHDMPAESTSDHPALAPFKQGFTIYQAARTDEAGYFALTQPRDKPFWGIMAVDQDMLPVYQNGISRMDTNAQDVVKLKPFELFPAARVVVTPAMQDTRVSVGYHWTLPEKADGGDESKWIEQLKKTTKYSHNSFHHAGWLKRNQPQTLLVPAEVPMRLWLNTPYAKNWSAGRLDDDLKLEKGQTLNIEQAVTFEKCVFRKVRVVDAQGEPVKDVAVRTIHEQDRAWAVSRRTNDSGIVGLYVEPARPGRFGIGIRPRVEVPFDMSRDDPNAIVEIRLTDEQVQKAKDLW